MSNMDAPFGGLSAHENDVWARFWAMQMQLPTSLDAQLKRDAATVSYTHL